MICYSYVIHTRGCHIWYPLPPPSILQLGRLCAFLVVYLGTSGNKVVSFQISEKRELKKVVSAISGTLYKNIDCRRWSEKESNRCGHIKNFGIVTQKEKKENSNHFKNKHSGNIKIQWMFSFTSYLLLPGKPNNFQLSRGEIWVAIFIPPWEWCESG